MQKHSTPRTSLISEYAGIAYFFILSFFPFDANIIKLLCLLTIIGCWLTKMLSEKKVLFVKTPLTIPILSFFLCSLIASLHSALIQDSLGAIVKDYLAYFTIFFCMVNTIQGQEQIRRIVKAMLITCGLVCAYGLYGYYTGIAIRDERLVATFEYHARIAKYISLFLPIAVCLLFHYKNVLTRLYLTILIIVCSFSLILTMNRTSWVAMFVTILFIGFAAQKKLLLCIIVSVCALIVFILPAKFITHAKTITQVNKFLDSHKNNILGDRILCWKASIAIIQDHPWFGIGPGKKNFRSVYQQYAETIRLKERQLKKENTNELPEQTKGKKKRRLKDIEKLSHAHNIFLHIWAEAGTVGLLTFLWLFITIFYASIKAWRLSKAGYEKAFLMGIVASLISIFSHGLTDSFWKKPEALFLWYIIGIGFVVIHNTSKVQKDEFVRT